MSWFVLLLKWTRYAERALIVRYNWAWPSLPAEELDVLTLAYSYFTDQPESAVMVAQKDLGPASLLSLVWSN